MRDLTNDQDTRLQILNDVAWCTVFKVSEVCTHPSLPLESNDFVRASCPPTGLSSGITPRPFWSPPLPLITLIAFTLASRDPQP